MSGNTHKIEYNGYEMNSALGIIELKEPQDMSNNDYRYQGSIEEVEKSNRAYGLNPTERTYNPKPKDQYVWLVHPEAISVSYAEKEWGYVRVFTDAEKALEFVANNRSYRARKIKVND